MAHKLRTGPLLRHHLVVCFWLALLLVGVTFGFMTLLSSDLQIRRVVEITSPGAQKK